MPTVQQMIELSDTLTKTQTRIFEYMLNHPEAVCYDTLRNTAERIGVTEVSVLKVCRKLQRLCRDERGVPALRRRTAEGLL